MNDLGIDEQAAQQFGTQVDHIESSSQSITEDVGKKATTWGILRRQSDTKDEIPLLYRVKDGIKDSYTLGRGKDCDIIVDDISRRVSALHCKIYLEYTGQGKPRIFLENLSLNGTFVNDQFNKVSRGERIELRSGDEIHLTAPIPKKSGIGMVSELNSVGLTFVFINILDRLISNRGREIVPSKCLSHVTNQVIQLSQSNNKINLTRVFADEYIIGEQLGSGMSGDVFLCINRISMRKCAVKVIEVQKFLMMSTGSSFEDLASEAKIMQQLHHANIIEVLDYFQSPNTLHLVMELVQGGDLFDRIIARERYDEQTAKKVVLQILQAVDYLHSRDIIHRDLKPENILLVSQADDTMVKVTDFGLAKKISSEGLRTFCGTPQYFAPEVLQRKNTVYGAGRYGKAVDMWSIGVIAYVLLCGQFPFDEDNLFQQIERAEYNLEGEIWSSISLEGKSFINSLLTLRPEKRMSVKQALVHPWIQSNGTAVVIQNKGLNEAHATFLSGASTEHISKAAAIPSDANIINYEKSRRVSSDMSCHRTYLPYSSHAQLGSLSFAHKLANENLTSQPNNKKPVSVSAIAANATAVTTPEESVVFSNLGGCSHQILSSIAQEEELSGDEIEAYSSSDPEEANNSGNKFGNNLGEPTTANRKRKHGGSKKQKKTVSFDNSEATKSNKQQSLEAAWRRVSVKDADETRVSPSSSDSLVKLRSPIQSLAGLFHIGNNAAGKSSIK